ncbi:MAG: HAD family phosphatase [Planctomycetota bacterium]|nr:HAD family phosphatase [Planctomycetota bacterium]
MPNHSSITTIIFDWGGVLIDDPAPLLLSIFSRTLGVPSDALVNAFKHHAEPFQKGLCPESNFWQAICADLHVPPPTIPSFWGAAFREIYLPQKPIWSLARSLHQAGYKTALLSNTELPGVEFFRAAQPHCFDALIFSCCEHCRKPEKRIYDLALEKLHSRPDQTLFIDDNEHYVQGARDAGLHALRFTSPRALRKDLAALGVA